MISSPQFLNRMIEDTQQIVDTLRGLSGTADFTVVPEGEHYYCR